MSRQLDAYVYDAVRTPRARVRRDGGALAGVAPHELMGQLMHALDDRNGLSARGARVDEVILGVSTVTGAQAGNIARASAIHAGWPDDVSGTVVGRLCCSGLDALANAAAQVTAGTADLVAAGGVESMSQVPMMSDRPGIHFDAELAERTGFVTIGVSADATAAVAKLERAELDAYGLRSHRHSAAAWAAGHFDGSVIPVRDRDGEVLLERDDAIRPQMTLPDFEAMPLLFPDDAEAHARVGRRLPELGEFPAVHTAACAPQIVDGASLALIGTRSAGDALGARPRARIVATATAAVRSPLLTATLDAIRRALAMAGLTPGDLDIVEANESFSVSPLLVQREFGFPDDVLNVDGGAISMGHPLGASGGILLATALGALERTGGRYALLTIPAALGLGTAVVVERLD
ncbi:MAG: acetyl-CoA C-acyltransferase [Jatrophihabitans sp.]|uniref:acetyl-CoA C-acyltransferase n=1 Tax=Jatrophihabitans sp. TaxID=1932789 RepID=UPI003F7FB81C